MNSTTSREPSLDVLAVLPDEQAVSPTVSVIAAADATTALIGDSFIGFLR
ncbi:hypothetical protein [Microbacterium sp. LWH3-1.2]